jgi:hypothetical protein
MTIPRSSHARQTGWYLVVRPLDLAHRLLDVIEHRYDRDTDAPKWRCFTELGHPTVVGACARPLKLRVDAPRPEPETRAKRGRVSLRDAVGEQHLCCDAIAVDDFDAEVGIPCRCQFAFVARPPLFVEVLDQEVLFTGRPARDFGRDTGVESLAVLRVEVVAVHLRQQTCVTVG